MRIGIVYLGRRGAGGVVAFEAALALSRTADVFAVISNQAEHLPHWKNSRLDYVAVNTFQSNLMGLVSIVLDSPVRALAAQIQSREPDVLFFPMLHPWNPTLQGLLKPIPAVVVVHDATPHPGALDRFFAWLEDRSIRQAAHVIVLSQAMLPAITGRGVKGERVSVLPFPLGNYFQSPEGTPEGTARPRLLFFGRITSYKGLEVLLQAYDRIDPARRLPLQIVGEGSLAPYQALIIGKTGIEVHNRWVGDDQIAEYFSPGTILVLPYTSATQSGVVQIAATHAVPVIASRVGGIPEQVKDGVSGILVEPGSVEQLQAAVERLAVDPALACQLGENLRVSTQAERGWDVQGARLYEILEQAVRDQRRGMG